MSWRYYTDRADVWVEVGLDVAFICHPSDVVLSPAEEHRLLTEARRAYESRNGGESWRLAEQYPDVARGWEQ